MEAFAREHALFLAFWAAVVLLGAIEFLHFMALRGKGTAGRLMEGIAALARAQGYKIVPTCPYAVAWFKRHPEAKDVLA